MRPVKTWILIADARTARIVENAGPGKGLFQLEDKLFEAPQPNEHSDQEGRTFSSTTSSRHKLEKPDRGSGAANEYINGILETLQTSLRKGAYQRLIICAAPKTLGLINKALPKDLKAISIGQVNRDLTQVPTQELAKHFEDLIVI